MEVSVEGLTKRFGAVAAVRDVSFTVASGHCLALLGPSGCGKTTTLGIVAGFLDPDGGEVRVGGRAMTRVPPHRRNIGMVFQNYALFPHMTVFDNIAYGLRQRRTPPAHIAKAVGEVLELTRLEDLGPRYPRQLSGGQQQRVALARALVIKPDILLLDEPLSNLDAKLREAMRLELKQIHRDSGITTIFVTHDQAEAMVLADQVAVMQAGTIEQITSPAGLYERPANRFVAEFVGNANFVGGTITARQGGYATLTVPGCDRPVRVRADGERPRAGETGEFVLRPERMRLSLDPAADNNEFRARIVNLVFTGPRVECYLEWQPKPLLLEFNSGLHRVEVGQTVYVHWRADDAYLLRRA